MCASVTWSLGATKFLPPRTCRGIMVKPAAVAAVNSTNLRRLIGEPAEDFFGFSFSKSLEEPFCGFSFFMIKTFYVKERRGQIDDLSKWEHKYNNFLR